MRLGIIRTIAAFVLRDRFESIRSSRDVALGERDEARYQTRQANLRAQAAEAQGESNTQHILDLTAEVDRLRSVEASAISDDEAHALTLEALHDVRVALGCADGEMARSKAYALRNNLSRFRSNLSTVYEIGWRAIIERDADYARVCELTDSVAGIEQRLVNAERRAELAERERDATLREANGEIDSLTIQVEALRAEQARWNDRTCPGKKRT